MSIPTSRLLVLLVVCCMLTGCGYLNAKRQAELAARQAMQAEAEARAKAEEALAKLEQAKAGVVAPPETELEAKADEVKRKVAEDAQKQVDKAADAVKNALGGGKAAEAKPATDPNLLRVLSGHEGPVLGVAYSPDGKRIASASADKTVRVWNAKTGEASATLTGHKDEVTCVAFTADGKHVVSGSADKTLKIWDLEAKKELKTLEGHTDAVTCLAVFADGKHIISGSMDRSLRTWSFDSGLATGICTGHTLGVLCLAITDNGQYAVSGGQDRVVRLWLLGDKPGGRPTDAARLEAHKGWVKGVSIGDDGKSVLSVGQDGQFALSAIEGNVLTLRNKVDLRSGAIHAVSLRHAKMGLAGVEDRSVRQLSWLELTGHQASMYSAFTFNGHEGPVLAVAFSPDGLIAVSGSEDKTVRLWNIPR